MTDTDIDNISEDGFIIYDPQPVQPTFIEIYSCLVQSGLLPYA